MLASLNSRILFYYLIIFFISFIQNVTASYLGTCENYSFPIDSKGKISEPNTIKVIQDNTSVFKKADSVEPYENIKLGFNDSLNVIDANGSRLLVRRLPNDQPLGWVESNALLCNQRPLAGDSGLEKKFYIITETERRYEEKAPKTVSAYPSSDLKGCNNQCRQLGRFNGYFVVAEDHEHNSFLLSEDYIISDATRLVGWANSDDGFIWDTAYALRPKENLVDADGKEKSVCVYRTIKDAISNQNCLPILGGDRWFLTDMRIPILGQVEKNGRAFYKVVIPVAGFKAQKGKDSHKIVIKEIDPTNYATTDIDVFKDLQNIDVFFLIDGTKSMQGYIDIIKGDPKKGIDGLPLKIIKQLKKDPKFIDSKFRFGFRIYRDKYAGNDELGEGMTLPLQCKITQSTQKENLKSFENTVKDIKTTYEINDDYYENLYGGIKKALQDLRRCSGHMKILFIIGDCGYSALNQRNKGREPIEPKNLAEAMQTSIEENRKGVITFFIQSPNVKQTVKHADEYQKAYDFFTEQAHEILKNTISSKWHDQIDEHFFLNIQKEPQDLESKIIESIKLFTRSDIYREVIVDLRGGASLVNIIERLQKNENYKRIPGLFWDQLKISAEAGGLGQQIDTSIYETVVIGYIPISDDIVEDIWITSSSLEKWKRILSELTRKTGTGEDLRKQFQFALKDSLENLVRKPLYERTKEPIKTYLERAGKLPVRDNSPLFLFSFDDFKNENVVPNCLLERLQIWVYNSEQMLHIISSGNQKPKYEVSPYPGFCNKGKGIDIPFVDGSIGRQNLGRQPEMKLDWAFNNVHIYWVPKEYLP